MKKATCTTFVSILNTIHEEGITNKTALMADQLLYTEFWFALKDFCAFALHSKTNGKNSDGEIRLGNTGKIDVLEKRGVTTREEVETDCVIKIIEKLDLVLSQPAEKQKNYCYAICNNMVNDCCRQLLKDDLKFVSLYSAIEGASVAEEGKYTYEDVIADFTYDPLRVFSEKETINELKEALKIKQARELAVKKEDILREISLLRKRPAEVLVRIACTHLDMRPRELAKRLVNDGADYTFANVLLEVSNKNNIKVEDLRNALDGNRLTDEAVKVDTMDEEAVSAQISRLVYRANKNLCK